MRCSVVEAEEVYFVLNPIDKSVYKYGLSIVIFLLSHSVGSNVYITQVLEIYTLTLSLSNPVPLCLEFPYMASLHDYGFDS